MSYRRRSELIIRSAVRNDTGRYECRAKNKLASKPVSNFTRIEVLPKDYVPTSKSTNDEQDRPLIDSKLLTEQPIGWGYPGSNCPHEGGDLFCLNGGKCVFFMAVGEPACT